MTSFLSAAAFAAFFFWAVVAVASTLSAWRYVWGLPLAETPGRTPPVAVIVAVKGAGAATEAFLARLRAQDYPAYRVVAAVEHEDDPAFRLLADARAAPGAPLELVVAGRTQRGGQKVANLLAALERLGPGDEIVAFTDADTLPGPRWLPRLVSALVDAHRDAATGYRWILPADGRLSSCFVAAANASIVTMPRVAEAVNLCWGGSTALPRATLERADVKAFWRGALSDDLQMTRALRAAAIAVHSPRQSLLLSPFSASWREAFAFGRRQYRIVLLHEPLLWAFAVATLALPLGCGLFALWLALHGDPAGLAFLIAAAALGDMRFRCRRRIVAALWPETAQADLRLYWRVERFLRPLWQGFHLACALGALGSRRISWAGTEYLVRAPQDVDVLARRATFEAAAPQARVQSAD